MRAYKFLDAEDRAPFTGTPWRQGEWVESARAATCREGVHGCSPWDLSTWLAHSLWEIELDGEIVEGRHKVAGSRGRLVRRIDGYPEAVRALQADGAWRSRDRAVDALGREGRHDLAGRFRGAATLEELAALGADVDDRSWSERAAALAADAAHFAHHGDHAQSPFVAACSAGHHAAGPGADPSAYDRGYAAERAHQSAWLAERLGLA